MDPVDGKIGYKFGDSALNRYDWIQNKDSQSSHTSTESAYHKKAITMTHFNLPEELEGQEEIFGSEKAWVKSHSTPQDSRKGVCLY